MMREKDTLLAKRQKQQEIRQADLRAGRIRISVSCEEEILEKMSPRGIVQQQMRKAQEQRPQKVW